MSRLAAALACMLLPCGGLLAQDRAGDFDYFVLALSWSPSWCAVEGEARGAAECAEGAGLGFTLHGLWPQYERGWPEDCVTEVRDPTRSETAAAADLFGSAELAWHQWLKHGRCVGEDPADYFATARLAAGLLDLPDPEPGQTTAARFETAFRQRNPAFGADAVTVVCREDVAMELRLCLTPDLDPRTCGADVLERACRPDRSLTVPPIR